MIFEDKPSIQKSAHGVEASSYTNIVNSCHKASKDVLGFRKNGSRQSVNPKIIELSNLQKEIQTKINNSNAEDCQTLRRQRNKIMNEIHRILEKQKHNKIIEGIQEVERHHEDSGKMYAAVKILQGKRKKIPLLVDTKYGITTHEQTQVDIITDFYEKQFNQLDVTGILDAKPCAMIIPFKKDEVNKAINRLGNNKAEDINKLKGEHLKNCADIIQENVAEIFNEMAKTGEYPKEIKRGILTPLVKNKQKQGPCKKLRPIILL